MYLGLEGHVRDPESGACLGCKHVLLSDWQLGGSRQGSQFVWSALEVASWPMCRYELGLAEHTSERRKSQMQVDTSFRNVCKS